MWAFLRTGIRLHFRFAHRFMEQKKSANTGASTLRQSAPSMCTVCDTHILLKYHRVVNTSFAISRAINYSLIAICDRLLDIFVQDLQFCGGDRLGASRFTKKMCACR